MVLGGGLHWMKQRAGNNFPKSARPTDEVELENCHIHAIAKLSYSGPPRPQLAWGSELPSERE